MDQESKKILEDLRERTQSARNLSNIFSFSGIVAIPLAFVGISTGNKALAACSLCWLVSHFVGYITRMVHEEHRQAGNRLQLAESALSIPVKPRSSPFPDRVSLN